MRTVEKRCETRIVMRPLLRRRAARRRGVALEQRVLGLGVERRRRLVEHEQQRRVAHEAARQRELLPLAERDLDAARPGRPELRVEARRQPRDDVAGAARARRPSTTAGSSSSRGTSPTPTVCRARNSKRKKSWNAPASRARHSPAGTRASGAPSTRIAPDGRLVHLREQLDERRLARAVLADDRDDRARRQRQRHVVEHEPRRCPGRRTRRARGGCRAASAAGTGRSRRRRERRGVVLEPGEAPRAVHPEAAQEADLADRGADVGRQPRARGEHQQHVAGRRARGRTRRRRPRRRTRAPKTAHASACHSAEPQRAAATGPYQRSHAARRSATRRSPMPVTRTSLPGGAVVAIVNRCRASRLAGAPRSCAARSTAGRHVDVNTVGSANTREQQRAPDGSTPAARSSRRAAGSSRSVENSDMYMWSSTKTWLRSIDSRSRYSGRSWCAIVATDACSRATCDSSAIVTLSRKRRCTRVLTVRRNQVAAADTPRPIAAASTSAGRSLEHALAEQLEPEREQRVGQRRELRQHERARASAAARGGSRACTAATSTTARAAAASIAARSTLRQRTSYVVPSSSSATLKRCACRSNIVR